MDDLRESEETLQLIGIGLIGLQYTEHLLDICLRLVLSDDESRLRLDWETIGILQGRATLGILLKRLQEKVNVHPDLEICLGEFLEKRNRFVHRLLEIPEFHLSAGPGHQEINRFRSEEHTSELQSHLNLVCRLLLEKKKKQIERK